MDGPHDLGGRTGYGVVAVESDEPAFHEPWEAKAWALNMVAIGRLRTYTTDAYRHSVERMNPDWYLRAGYYERMLTGVTTLLVEHGVLTLAEIERRAGGVVPVAGPVARAATVPAETPVGDVGERPTFGVGDRVVVTAIATPGHSRCPGYLRGHCGTVVRIYTRAYYPEFRAHSPLKRREFTYAVEFDPTELWSDGDSGQTVIVELFESYMNRIETP